MRATNLGRVRPALLLIASVFALSSLAHADVLVVAADGSGSFNDLPAAVAAAADGDVLLVQSGTYSGFVVTDKQLDIVADSGANAVIQGQVAITGLGATRSLTLTGLVIRGPASAPPQSTPALRFWNCAGSLRVQGCDVAGHAGAQCVDDATGATGVEIAACQDVAFARCTLSGGDAGDFGAGFGYGGYGGACIGSSNSRIALHDCTLRGGRGSWWSAACGTANGYAGSGGDGGKFVSCPTIFAARSSFLGGDGGRAFFASCPGSGLELGASNVTTLECSALHGAPGVGTFGDCVGEDVTINPPATYTPLAGAGRTLTTNRVVREGNDLRLELTGQLGDVVEVTIAERARFQSSAAWRGVNLVRTPRPAPILLAGTIDSTGQIHFNWPITDLGPGVASRRFFLQAAFRDTTGVTTLSTPATVVLLDSAY